jgi:SRSO17 transposase
MSLLEHPQAQALLADAEVSATDVRGCAERLTGFLERYLPWFYREEQRALARVVIQGKLSNLQRKTSEPIAYAAERERKPVQHFVGAGKWDDEAVMAELRRHVAEVLGDPQGVFVVDSSAFAKKGTESCGVQRQWCGRLGKLENCQVGVFLSYAAARGHAPLDRQLYVPQEWADDTERRDKTHVPDDVEFQEKWRIALDLIDRSQAVPHGWIVGDDEFGRATEFRSALRWRREQYVLDVPSNTLVRELVRDAAGRKPAFERAEVWAARQPAGRWKTLTVRPGEKGPLRVRALQARVQTKDEDGHVGPAETLVVTRTLDQDNRTTYRLSNAPRAETLPQLVAVGGARHRMEEDLQAGKGEVGLGHYEVRSWVGWNHHITLSFLALWFLVLENLRVGGKNPGHDGAATARTLSPPAASHAPQPRPDRPRNQPRAPPHRRSPHLPLLRDHQNISPTAAARVFVKGLQ